MTQQTPYEVMRVTLSQERSLSESVPVTLPAWAATGLLRMANTQRHEVWQRGAGVEGQLDTLGSRLSRATEAALGAAGLPGGEGPVFGQTCTVRLWQMERGERCAARRLSVRPLRLTSVHTYRAAMVQPSGEARCIIDRQR